MCRQCDNIYEHCKTIGLSYRKSMKEDWTERSTNFNGKDGLFHTITNWECSSGHKWKTEETYKPLFEERIYGFLDNLNEEK
jgi:hypothetical protein